jgi:hypothetical protein
MGKNNKKHEFRGGAKKVDFFDLPKKLDCKYMGSNSAKTQIARSTPI